MLIKIVRPLMREAGKIIMDVYRSSDFEVRLKNDDSPVTRADKYSNEAICRSIKNFSDFPIVSEEGPYGSQNCAGSSQVWLVDPLDGTKDFISKNNEFTINIALMNDGIPVFGAIYLPATDVCYWAEKDMGSYRDEKKISNNAARSGAALIGTVSRFHETAEDRRFFNANGITDVRVFGGAIKFCRLAEGVVDVYPRFVGSKQWDTAAGQLIAEEAGCSVLDMVTHRGLTYQVNRIRNNNFVAFRSDLNLNFL